MAKVVVPLMAKRRSGLIINIGSLAGDMLVLFPSPNVLCMTVLPCSATPWNGSYCASKAALQSISDILSMECKPFNISVLHVSPGSVKSNMAPNVRPYVADDTLYSAFLSSMIRIFTAAQSSAMPADEFANEVVSKALQTYPPRYMSLGGHSRLLSILKWLPKSWVLYLLWKEFSTISIWPFHY